MKGDITMSQKEIQRVRVLEQVMSGSLKLIEATGYLGISYRQAKRLKLKYRESGPVGILHGNRGRIPSNVLDADTKKLILEFSAGEYADFNDTHFVEMLQEKEGILISRESVRKIRRANGQEAKRKRRAVKHRSRRPRKPCAGMLVQWDGSRCRQFVDRW